ncbi:hypothetical protein [Desulfobacula sp.]|uniref:carboxylate--amine ligase n=1 Tax=Desulfobacula sp. TaxID=2593537 RepID=UPI0025C63720|nr:hypothetical protein [Desulfobacula sp.]MBC2704224.1 hypothetical protein [Desulfobacula sp.]
MTLKPGVIIIEGHVQGLSNTRSLGGAGISVVVVDTGDCVARHSRYCREFYQCPSFDSDDLADFLLELAVVKGFEGWLLMPSNDHAVLTLSRNKTRLEKHFKVITPKLEIIENIYDKSRLLDVAQKAEVPIPGTYYANDAAPAAVPLSFPVLTRGRFGLDFYRATGRKAFLADNIDELRRQLSFIDKNFPIQKTLTQELIPDDGTNKTISFTAFCVNGKIKTFWMGEKLREHPIRFGTATFARSIYVKACYTQSVPLIMALDYTGVCEVEYLKDPGDGQYKLIEINARTWLWVGLAKACGVDFARMAYEYMNGMDTVYPDEYETGVCWINPLTDTAYAAKAIFKGQLSPLVYAKSLKSKKVNALFAQNDWKPGFIYCLSLLKFLKNR